MSLDVITSSCTAPVARLILAHGAGAPMDSQFMEELAQLCCERDLEVVRFEFPYMAQRRHGGSKRPPNKQDQLLEVWQQIIDMFAGDALPLFIGGKSMGGRMASLWAADRGPGACLGVLCFGYPFHPPGKPEKLRIEHLPRLAVRALVIQGERDPMGEREEVSGYPLGRNVVCHWIMSANHDLVPLKRCGVSAQQAMADAADTARAFVARQLQSVP